MVNIMTGEHGPFMMAGLLDVIPNANNDRLFDAATVLLENPSGQQFTLRVETQVYHDHDLSEDDEADIEPVFLVPDLIDPEILDEVVNVSSHLLKRYVTAQAD